MNLESFYAEGLGQASAHSLAEAVTQLVASIPTAEHALHSGRMTVLGLGACGWLTPHLPCLKEAPLTHCLLEGTRPYLSAANAPITADEYRLPYKDEAFDLVLLTHGLEYTADPHQLLREVWRVLSPLGKLIVITPHRKSLWAWRDTTPFGHGTPYTPPQLKTLLSQNLFTPVTSRYALTFLPTRLRYVRQLSATLGRVQRYVDVPLLSGGGAVVMLAEKLLYAPTGPGSLLHKLKEIFIPSPTPQPVTQKVHRSR